MNHRIIKNYPPLGEISCYPRRQKKIRLTFRNNEIRLSYPLKTPEKEIQRFLNKYQDQILQNRPQLPEIENGSRLGKSYQLILDPKISQIYLDKSTKTLRTSQLNFKILEKHLKLILKDEAEIFLLPKIKQVVNQSTKLKFPIRPKKINCFRYMATQWGSCNFNKKILNFNTALIYLPDDLIEYVVWHEICHLKISNHSAEFKNLLQKYYPLFKDQERKLKKYLPSLLPIIPRI